MVTQPDKGEQWGVEVNMRNGDLLLIRGCIFHVNQDGALILSLMQSYTCDPYMAMARSEWKSVKNRYASEMP